MIRSTHERLAYEATKYLPKERRDVLLAYVTDLLEGSKAPDRKFKDFRNHVLHPSSEGLRGGAIEAAKEWYKKSIEYARKRDRKRFAFAMGVLSHYLADPTMPLHTSQEPGEENVHKFYERGTSELRRTWDIEPKIRKKSIEELLEESVSVSYPRYKDVMEKYDPHRGKPFNRKQGYTGDLYEITKELLSYALGNIVSVRLQVIEEANVKPDKKPGILSLLKASLNTLLGFLERVNAERELARMKKELKKYGSVIHPDEEQVAYTKIFSEAKKKGIYRSPLKPQEHKKIRFRLELDDPVEKAPGIGKKSAKRLKEIGIEKVSQLLEASDEDLMKAIRDPELVKKKTRLMYEIPGLLAREAEALALVGISTRKDLLEREGKEEELYKLMQEKLGGKKARGEPLALSLEEIISLISRAKLGRDY